jgi:hypothetical protein
MVQHPTHSISKTEDTYMLERLRTLFAPADPFAHDAHFHYHIDESGNRRFCDESACRPTRDPSLWSLPLVSPYRR